MVNGSFASDLLETHIEPLSFQKEKIVMLNSHTLKQEKILQIPATAVTIGAMLLLPFLVHFLPPVGGVPMGARLLPIFYAPLLAAIFFNPAVGIIASLVTPLINYTLTGMPDSGMVVILTVELAIFSILMQRLYHRWPKFGGLAPIAYLMAKVASLFVLLLVPVNLIAAPPWQFFLASLRIALPGMAILLAINLSVVWMKRQSDLGYDGE